MLFAELCRWAAGSQPICEVMKRLSGHDLDRLESFGLWASEAEADGICGELPQPGIQIVQEYCALSRKRRHVQLTLSGTHEGGAA